MRDADWLELFDTVANAPEPEGANDRRNVPGRARYTVLLGMLDAIRTLSCRVCALGLEPILVHSYSEIENFDSPFLMQNIEVNLYLDEYARQMENANAQPGDARHLLVMLEQCDDVVAKIRKNARSIGTSIALTYVLVALTQSIDRLRKLLFLFETLPIFAAAVVVAHVAGREGDLTLWGAWLYLVGRVVYVPLYAAGIPYVRSLVWAASMVGLGMILYAVLTG